MKIFCLFSFIGLFACKIIMPFAVEIYYNYEYPLLKDYSRRYNEYDFKLRVIPGDKMDVEIKFAKGENNSFTLYSYGFPYNPSEKELSNDGTQIYYSSQHYYYEDNYVIHASTIQVPAGCSYLGIRLTQSNYYNYSYLTLTANATKYKYSNIYDLSTIKRIGVDTAIFGYGNIPYQYHFFAKAYLNPVPYHNTVVVSMDTWKAYDKYTAFQVDVCEYKSEPTDYEIYSGNEIRAIRCLKSLVNYSLKGNTYYYNFTKHQFTKYVSVRIINNLQNLVSLSIYVSSFYQPK